MLLFYAQILEKTRDWHCIGARFYRSKNSVFFIGRCSKIGLI